MLYVRTFKAWYVTTNSDEKAIEDIPKEDLAKLLQHFYWEIKTSKGEDFEPSSLKTIQRGLDRYLQEKNTGYSIIRDEIFQPANKALEAKMKALKKDGKGNKPNATEAPVESRSPWQTQRRSFN